MIEDTKLLVGAGEFCKACNSKKYMFMRINTSYESFFDNTGALLVTVRETW